MAETLVIASRFCGPPKSGNGGYVCGRLAGDLPAATVRLKAPPPLETELRIERDAGGARLLLGEALIGEAKVAPLDLAPPAAPSYAAAEEASKSYIGFRSHVFPRCFVCGPKRDAGDGLRIFPGTHQSMVAAPWVPDASLADGSQVRREFLWSALDCTGAFAVVPEEADKSIMLGELAARIDGPLAPGDRCVVIGWKLHVDGRKRFAGSAVFSAAGKAVAVARATWIEVPRSAFGGQ